MLRFSSLHVCVCGFAQAIGSSPLSATHALLSTTLDSFGTLLHSEFAEVRTLRMHVLLAFTYLSMPSIHVYIHVYIYTYINVYLYACMHAYIHKYIHAYIHTYMHTYMQIYRYTYIHVYICT